jgi:NAD(P)-dependent dehydrogenase (short-subunit alcohol dehydrogenase family)
LTPPRNRVALVTGTSSGFGRDVAERLIGLDWSVVGTVRGGAQQAPEGCEPARLDLRAEDEIVALGRSFNEQHRRLDALICNAGYFLAGPLEEISPQELREQLEVNLVGTLGLVRQLLPALRKARGVVVLVSSISGRGGSAGFGAYCASKFALGGAGESLAEELAPDGVRVVIVEPGLFAGTEIGGKARMPAAGDPEGHYRQVHEDLREFIDTTDEKGQAPELAIEAIVRAATVRGAPLHLPVGDNAIRWLREQADEAHAQLDHAERFLR